MKVLRQIEWFLDYNLGKLLCNERKLHLYHELMINKWGKKYTDLISSYEKERQP